jgi:alpha-beta hydrolase superfamily lysophospholipase
MAKPLVAKTFSSRHSFVLARWLFICALIAYAMVCVYLFAFQTQLIYPEFGNTSSAETAVHEARLNGLVPWSASSFGLADPRDTIGYVRPDFNGPAPRGTIVVFHGNGGLAAQRTHYVDAFSRRGFRVFLYEYPGYGGRTGRPGEAVIVPDAQALVYSLDHAGYGPVYIWGESLGSGVAAAVCADPKLPVHGLVLLTPWDNIANVALSIYPYIPIRLLMIDKYDSVANLQHFAHPVCVIRSSHDEIIPPSLSLNLISHLPEPKKVIVHEACGHNDWPSSPELAWWDDALDFIAPKVAR